MVRDIGEIFIYFFVFEQLGHLVQFVFHFKDFFAVRNIHLETEKFFRFFSKIGLGSGDFFNDFAHFLQVRYAVSGKRLSVFPGIIIRGELRIIAKIDVQLAEESIYLVYFKEFVLLLDVNHGPGVVAGEIELLDGYARFLFIKQGELKLLQLLSYLVYFAAALQKISFQLNGVQAVVFHPVFVEPLYLPVQLLIYGFPVVFEIVHQCCKICNVVFGKAVVYYIKGCALLAHYQYSFSACDEV